MILQGRLTRLYRISWKHQADRSSDREAICGTPPSSFLFLRERADQEPVIGNR